MKQRLSDTPENINDAKQFVARHPFLDPWKILTLIALCFFVTLFFAYNFDTWGKANMVAAITAVFLLLLGYFGFTLTYATNTLLASEFENALFAGANNAGVEFTLIMNSDGKMVYISPGSKNYFRGDLEIKNAEIENVLTIMGLDEIDRIHIISNIKAKTKTTRNVQLFDAFGFIQDVYLILRPISRPKGYMMLKAVKLEEELKQQMADKRKADPYLVQLLNSLPVGGYLATESGLILYANEPFTEMLGYSKGEIVTAHLSLDDLFFGHEVMERDMLSEWDGIIALRHKQKGKPLKRHIRQIAVTEGDEAAPLICGFIVPKNMREDIAPADKTITEVWVKALENAPISIAFLDMAANVTQSNQAFRAMAGKKTAQGWNLNEIVDPEQHQQLKEKLKEVSVSVTQENISPLEIRMAENKERNALLYISSMGEDGEGFIAHLVDTTRQKTFEQRMAQSQKMQAVGQLAGGIAHDFNNLLTAMIGFCDLLLIKHPAGDPSFPDIMQIKQNANRAANLVRQLLAFSRKQTLQPQIIDVTEALAELSNLITRLIGENIEFKIVHGQNIDFVKVDKVQFEQVIINLAVNARDAMKGGGTLTFRTKNVKIDKNLPFSRKYASGGIDEVIADGKYVMIDVEDTGEGIDASIIGKIFDPFFSTKETGSGTGLGLATVHGIVKQTGGYIYVNSEKGKGTTFSIFLPAVDAKEVAKQRRETARQQEKESDLTGKGTILLVEDEAPVRVFSVRALSNKGYTVLEAENGEAGLRIIGEQGKTIDIIITDVMMPGIDGPTMIKKVWETYPNIKVIFISGYGEDAFGKTFGSEREFNFLPKPYSLKDLASKVKEVMGK